MNQYAGTMWTGGMSEREEEDSRGGTSFSPLQQSLQPPTQGSRNRCGKIGERIKNTNNQEIMKKIKMMMMMMMMMGEEGGEKDGQHHGEDAEEENVEDLEGDPSPCYGSISENRRSGERKLSRSIYLPSQSHVLSFNRSPELVRSHREPVVFYPTSHSVCPSLYPSSSPSSSSSLSSYARSSSPHSPSPQSSSPCHHYAPPTSRTDQYIVLLGLCEEIEQKFFKSVLPQQREICNDQIRQIKKKRKHKSIRGKRMKRFKRKRNADTVNKEASGQKEEEVEEEEEDEEEEEEEHEEEEEEDKHEELIKEKERDREKSDFIQEALIVNSFSDVYQRPSSPSSLFSSSPDKRREIEEMNIMPPPRAIIGPNH